MMQFNPLMFVSTLLLAWLPSFVMALSSADYYISSLPGLTWPDNALKMHAGHIALDPEHHGEMFFWHVQRKHLQERQRTVLWLNGGPGCSSMDGLLLEIGPFRLTSADTLVENEGSWHEYANLLFIDNPLGTGFSFVDSNSYVSELDQMTKQLMSFMDKFLDLFPEYAQDDFYIAGESFAGQYIPYVGQAMLESLSDRAAGHKFHVKGLLIGNGWIDPMAGYNSYLPFALNAGLIKEGTKEYREVEQALESCIKAEQSQGVNIHIPACEGIMSKIFEVTLKQKADGTNMCINAYDYTLQDTYPSCGMNWPYELEYMNPYLRRADVLEAIHATDKKLGWTECNGGVSAKFRALKSKPSSELFPDLLRRLPILLFSGANDLICNHLSTEYFIGGLHWNGMKGFGAEPKQKWTFDGEDVGHMQVARNLTYVQVYNASHMVPYDKPRISKNMFNRFIGVDGSPLSESTVQPQEAATEPAENTIDNPSNVAPENGKPTRFEKLKQYYKAGSVALVVVIIAVVSLVYCIYKHRGSIKRRYGFDKLGLQETGRADESELEELTLRTPLFDADDNFDIGSDDEGEHASESSKPFVQRQQSASSAPTGSRSHRD